MKRRSAALAALCALALLFAACGKRDGAHEAQAKEEKGHADEHLVKLSDEEAARAGLKTQTVEEQALADTITLTATVAPNRERIAHVLPRLPGRIVSVAAKLGDSVKQGQPLARLESMEVGEAQAAHAQALAEANVAKAAFERAERLHAEQIIPGKEYERARGEYEKTRAHVRAAAGKLRMLGIDPGAEAGAAIAVFPVQAPLAGTVIERKAVLGELAKPDQPLFTIADLSTVWLEANVPENDLGRVRVGARARARVAAYPDQVFEGKVNHLAGALDKETRTAKAIVQLDNARRLLRPEMFASMAIDSGGARRVLAVPESAVTLVQGLPTVFVEEAAGFEPRPVELGERAGGMVVVKRGIAPGDSVVHEGVYALKARLLKSQIGEGHAH